MKYYVNKNTWIDEEDLQVIGARLFEELPEEQQTEARLLMMSRMSPL